MRPHNRDVICGGDEGPKAPHLLPPTGNVSFHKDGTAWQRVITLALCRRGRQLVHDVGRPWAVARYEAALRSECVTSTWLAVQQQQERRDGRSAQ